MITTYENYQTLALRTEAPIVTPDGSEKTGTFARLASDPHRYLRLIHSSLGLDSELSELESSAKEKDWTNTFGELGDLWWFVNVGFTGLDLNIHYGKISEVVASDYDTMSVLELIDDLDRKVADFQDHVKAHLFYGRTEFKLGHSIKLNATSTLAADLNAIAVGLCYLTRKIIAAAKESDIPAPADVLGVLTANIAKLSARYPNLFSEAAANERNEGTERAAIDGVTANAQS